MVEFFIALALVILAVWVGRFATWLVRRRAVGRNGQTCLLCDSSRIERRADDYVCHACGFDPQQAHSSALAKFRDLRFARLELEWGRDVIRTARQRSAPPAKMRQAMSDAAVRQTAALGFLSAFATEHPELLKTTFSSEYADAVPRHGDSERARLAELNKLIAACKLAEENLQRDLDELKEIAELLKPEVLSGQPVDDVDFWSAATFELPPAPASMRGNAA